MAKQEHRQTHTQREQQVQPETVVGISANCPVVLLTHKMTHADSQRSRHARKHEIEELREGYHHLMSRQRNGSQPAHHHTTQREGSRFHAQLQRHRPAQPVHLLKISLGQRTAQNIASVFPEILARHQHAHHRQRHQNAAHQRRNTGSQQTQFREARHTVNQYPVAQDIDYVAANHRPHRHLGLSESVKKLLHREEDAHEEHRGEVNQKVRTDEREQLFRLSDAPQIQVEHNEGEGEDDARQHVGTEGIAHFLSDAVGPFLAVEPSDDRSESVGESHIGYENETEDIVHQSGSRQFGCTVMANHQRISKSQDDGTQLSYDDRNSDSQQFPVVMFPVRRY